MGLDNANSEDRLQRGLEQKNVEQISNYIRNQSDMFFNSLVLAVIMVIRNGEKLESIMIMKNIMIWVF